MNGALAFNIAGAASEVAGLVVAAFGFHRTWAEFRKPDERFWQRLTAALDWATLRLSRLLHHHLPPRTVEVQGALHASFAASVRLSVTLQPLPSISEDQEAFAKMVQRHLEELNNRTQTTAHALHDEIEAAGARHKDTQRMIEQYRTEAHGSVQTVAVGGLRQQVVGWFLVLIGTVLQAIGQAMQSSLAA